MGFGKGFGANRPQSTIRAMEFCMVPDGILAAFVRFQRNVKRHRKAKIKCTACNAEKTTN